MEFQELSRVWQDADQALQKKIQLDLPLLEEIDQRKVRPQLTSYLINVLIELGVGLAFQSFLNGFIGQHLDQTPFLIPALLLAGLNIYSILFNGYQLYLYFQTNLNKPILEAQRMIARLRFLERVDTYSLLAIIPLFAGPFLIVMAKHFLDLDLYLFKENFLPFFLMNVGVAIIIVSLLRLFPDKRLKESQEILNSISQMEEGYVGDLVWIWPVIAMDPLIS